MRNERYTEEQKLLLKFKPETEEEEYVLRRALIPRKQYLPQSEEEAGELALMILGKREYQRFCDVCADIGARFGAKGSWSAGDKRWKLFYHFEIGGKSFCRLALYLDVFEIQFSFGEKEMRRFETERETYARLGVQWTYDLAEVKNGRKRLSFDLRNSETYEQIFRLLSYRIDKENPSKANKIAD